MRSRPKGWLFLIKMELKRIEAVSEYKELVENEFSGLEQKDGEKVKDNMLENFPVLWQFLMQSLFQLAF